MKNEEKIKVIAIVGPTASGKTGLSIKLAQRLGGEIVSADSIQVYEGMQIASAKPSESEKEGIPHYLIGYVPMGTSYNVSIYVSDAKKVIDDIVKRGKLPIVVGGTGLYIDSLLNSVSFSKEDNTEKIRRELEIRLEKEGIEALYNELSEIDPKSAESIHINNTKRVLRALEIYYTTGKTMTEQKKLSKAEPSPYDVIYIGLKCKDREKLYDRINKRVDIMLEMGLLEEAKQVLKSNLSETAKAAIGYKELKPYIDGEVSFSDAVEKLKRETRRYAKRQLTWFMRNDKINWIDIDTLSVDEIIKQAENICKEVV